MSVENIAVSRAVALLNAAKVQYKIITGDGAEYGDLVAVEPKPRKRAVSKYPIGTLKAHYHPYIKDLQPSQTAYIPFDKFEPEEIRGPLCAWCSVTWGAGSFVTSLNRDKRLVELLRVA